MLSSFSQNNKIALAFTINALKIYIKTQTHSHTYTLQQLKVLSKFQFRETSTFWRLVEEMHQKTMEQKSLLKLAEAEYIVRLLRTMCQTETDHVLGRSAMFLASCAGT